MLEVDPLSNRGKEVDATYINSDGEFSFSFQAKGTARYFLRIRHSYNYFLAEPGNILQVKLEAPGSPGQPLEPSFLRLRQNLSMELRNRNQEQYDLNALYESLGDMVASYLEDEVAPRVRASHRRSLQAFMQRVDSVFRAVEHPFFEASLRYQMAYLQSVLLTSPVQQLIQKYLQNQPILYNHPDYMDFFSSVMDSYVFTGSRHCQPRDLQRAVNREACHHSLLDCLSEDPIYDNPDLLEFTMIRALQNMLFRDDFDTAKVLAVLEQIAFNGTHERHRELTSSIIKQYAAVRTGSPAPELVVPDQEGRIWSLEDFSGQFVYLFFGASWCPVSMAEISIIHDMPVVLNGHLSVVVILLDENGHDFVSRLDDRQDHVLILPFGGNYRLLDRYRIRSTPQYFLIGPGGEIRARDFLAPSAGAAREIRRIADG